MNIVDWRHVDARGVALLYARERARWLVDLGWETRESWAQVEQARTTWGLPGLAAVDDRGRVRGVVFLFATDGRFDIGGVCAESDDVREALVDAAVSLCEEAGGQELAAFLHSATLPASGALSARGFAVDRVDYLCLALHDGDSSGREGRGAEHDEAEHERALVTYRDWEPGDIEAMAALLHASYDASSARRFVPDASVLGWRHYVSTLVEHRACGVVMPSATRLAVIGDTLVGGALVTDLGPATAHIAQVVVRPEWRRRGVAAALITGAADRARAAGYGRITLLASATNTAAQALYRSRGYVQRGTFLALTKQLRATPGAGIPESIAS